MLYNLRNPIGSNRVISKCLKLPLFIIGFNYLHLKILFSKFKIGVQIIKPRRIVKMSGSQ